MKRSEVMQTLYHYIQQLEKRVIALSKKVKQLETELRNQPKEVHYKIQEVHIETLSGTLTIGTNGEVMLNEDDVDLFVNEHKNMKTTE